MQGHYEKSLAEYQETRRLALDALVALCFFGGLGLLLLVTMLALMKVVSGRYLWLPTMVAAACCALIGLSLMDPGRAKIERKVVPFAPAAVRPSANAGAPSALAKEAAPKTLTTLAASRYAYQQAAESTGQEGSGTETLYWNPLAIADPDGRMPIAFDLPEQSGAFDVLVDAHGDGRVGSGRTVIKVEGGGRKAEGDKGGKQ